MSTSERRRALQALTASTLALAACLAAWVMYGVLIPSLVEEQVLALDRAQMGWLIGIPALVGALLHLPVGALTERFGGRPVFTAVTLTAACGALAVSFARSFWGLAGAGALLGVAGASAAVGVAYMAVWFPRHRRGAALGVLGLGGVGVAVTAAVAPMILRAAIDGGDSVDGWRALPRVYAAVLVVAAAAFWLLSTNRTPSTAPPKPMMTLLAQPLTTLKHLSVWRFSLYDLLAGGGFFAISQWLIPYYTGSYGVSIDAAGLLAVLFILPSILARALGSLLYDRFGARAMMSWVLGVTAICTALLCIPKVLIETPGDGVLAREAGVVNAVSAREVTIDDAPYPLVAAPAGDNALPAHGDDALIWPRVRAWHVPIVSVGERVARHQPLARGVTQLYFQANIWIFAALVALIGVALGVGKAVVDKHIPDSFPGEAAAVAGVVSAIGCLGGFVLPVAFGYLLHLTGLWTTAWAALLLLVAACAIWMRRVIQRMNAQHAPTIQRQLDDAVLAETFTVSAHAVSPPSAAPLTAPPGATSPLPPSP